MGHAEMFMKLSWSHKLFLRINKTLGKNPLRDKIMYFFGQWLIFVMAGVLGVLALIFLEKNEYIFFFGLLLAAFLLAYAISYTIAILFKHPRPIRELPNVKELIIPIETWKSFPSDHTIAVTLMTIFSWYATYSFPIVIAMGFTALGVMAGRVYCGVHYPRDILGGIVVASLSTFIVLSGFVFFMFLKFGNPIITN